MPSDTVFPPWEPTKVTQAEYERWCVVCAHNGWTPPATKEDYEKQIDKCRKAIREVW